ncbi:MAG: protein-glutamate O-methyltransferase CheR [Acidobacteriota bacterium]|nr:protein-glutamate O-methyltransferase CheR [Acidobacteriota bacterium]
MSSTPTATNRGVPNPACYQIRDLIYSVAGIFHAENRLAFLEDRCGRRMKELNFQNLRQYFEYLTCSAERTSEMTKLLNEITVGETFFFRNQPQINAMQRLVLPSIVATKQQSHYKHLRIWSAGCSTGEEPYTMAILLIEELQRFLRGFTFEIIATDLNERSLLRCKEGTYGDYALRNVSPDLLRKYFEAVPGTHDFRVKDEVRKYIKFSRLNLSDDSKMVFVKSLDVIFCCNVLIYFDGASKKRVIQHFYNNLLPNSYLFLGHSESLFGINDEFRLVHFPGAMAYVKSPVPGKK